MLSNERLLYAVGAFFLCQVLYTIGFASHMTLAIFWPLPLLILGAVLIMLLWSQLDELRWPVCTYIGVTLLMVWIAGEQYFQLGNDYTLSLLTGTALLLVAASVWLISH